MESRKMVLINLFTGQQWSSKHKEQTWTQRRRGWDELREQHGNIHSTVCKIDTKREFLVWHREINPVLCDILEGWEMAGRLRKEGTYVYLWLIHVDVWQKPTQHCKAAIPQLKKYIYTAKSPSELVVRKKTAQNPSLYDCLPSVHHTCTFWMAENKFSKN